MSILLYCVTEKNALPNLGTGVGGLPVLCCEQDEIAALFSDGTSGVSWTGASVNESARRFHRVLHRIFESRAIIPFRFPTLMANEEELGAHLRVNVAEYSSQLKKFANSVQMDVSIAEADSRAADQTSGAEYLRARQKRLANFQAVAKQVQELASEAAQGWCERPASNGLKLYALVDRASVAALHERLKEISVPANMSVRATGPWPVTEFLDLKQS